MDFDIFLQYNLCGTFIFIRKQIFEIMTREKIIIVKYDFYAKANILKYYAVVTRVKFLLSKYLKFSKSENKYGIHSKYEQMFFIHA